MIKKYKLDYSQFFFTWFRPVFGVFLLLTVSLTAIVLQAIYLFISSSKMPQYPLLEGAIISLGPLWYLIYIVWKEFRFPVLWLSDSGITVLAIAIMPIRIHILWENILGTSDKKTLAGTLFDFGTSVTIKPVGNTQKRVFKIIGGNEIFISNKISQYNGLIDLIKTRIDAVDLHNNSLRKNKNV